MNGKKAKLLRRWAEGKTAGKPNTTYQEWSPPIFRDISQFTNSLPRIVKVQKGVPCRLAYCTRSVYKQAKSAYKARRLK